MLFAIVATFAASGAAAEASHQGASGRLSLTLSAPAPAPASAPPTTTRAEAGGIILRLSQSLNDSRAPDPSSPGTAAARTVEDTGARASAQAANPSPLACPGGPPPGLLALDEAITRALCRHPRARQALASARLQAAQLALSNSARLPTLDATAELSRASSRTTFNGIATDSGDGPLNARNATLRLGWVLFDFGTRGANTDRARELLAAATATHDATVQAVFAEVAQAYLRALTAQAELHTVRQIEAAAAESLRTANGRHAGGVGMLTDTLQARTAWNQETLNRIGAEGTLKSALGTLALLTGLPASQPLQLDDTALAAPRPDLPQEIDALLLQALEQHPGLRAARAELRAAEARLRAANSEGLPSVSLSATQNFSDQRNAVSDTTRARGNTIGLTLTAPLFEGFGHIHRVRAARAQVEVQQANLGNVEEQISLEVWKAYQDLSTQSASLNGADELVRNAREAFRVAQGRYRSGVGSILELLNAQAAVASAERQRIQALSGWHSARVRLAAGLGRLGLETLRSPG